MQVRGVLCMRVDGQSWYQRGFVRLIPFRPNQTCIPILYRIMDWTYFVGVADHTERRGAADMYALQPACNNTRHYRNSDESCSGRGGVPLAGRRTGFRIRPDRDSPIPNIPDPESVTQHIYPNKIRCQSSIGTVRTEARGCTGDVMR